jgi:hypothetical protein
MSAVADYPEVSTLLGTPEEVRASLAGSHVDRVLLVSFEHLNSTIVDSLAKNLADLAVSMHKVFWERQESGSLERLAEVLIPRTPPSPRLLKEAAMLIRARRAVLDSGDWLTAADIAKAAELSTVNPSAQPNKWKKLGQIFAIHHGGVDYFPGYGLDPDSGYRPLKVLTKVIEAFDGRKDGWGMAYWFQSDNSFLGGRRPQDLLALQPQLVVDAALDDTLEIAHG